MISFLQFRHWNRARPALSSARSRSPFTQGCQRSADPHRGQVAFMYEDNSNKIDVIAALHETEPRA